MNKEKHLARPKPAGREFDGLEDVAVYCMGVAYVFERDFCFMLSLSTLRNDQHSLTSSPSHRNKS